MTFSVLSLSIAFNLSSRDCGCWATRCGITFFGRMARNIKEIKGEMMRLIRNQPKPLLFLDEANTATIIDTTNQNRIKSIQAL